MEPSTAVGHVYLVGAGPGDPELLTLAGRRALETADVILYDALIDPALLECARPDSELIFVGKRASAHARSQEEISSLLVERAREGKRVVRLKGGDPFLFGRGGGEALACRAAGVPFTVVPGVTSAVAVPAYAGIPITHRGVSSGVFVVTGTAPDGTPDEQQWEAAAAADTVVILMGTRRLREIVSTLIERGRPPDEPAALIRAGTTPRQEVVRAPLARLPEAVAEAGDSEDPGLIVVGKVVALADDLHWYCPGPLAGVRVAVTRAKADAGRLAGMLRERGATVIEAPVIDIRLRPERLAPVLDEAFDWIVLTSRYGFESLWQALRARGRDARALAGTRVAAVGPSTASALERAGILADYVASEGTAATLAAELPVAPGERVLHPRSSLAREDIDQLLGERGAAVTAVTAYETVPGSLDESAVAALRSADVITFTSASTARYLAEALGGRPLPPHAKLVSIGPTTSEAVRQYFGRVDAQAARPSLEALLEKVVEVAHGSHA